MKHFLLLWLLFMGIIGATTIDKKIADTSKTLKNFDRNYASVNAKMGRTAKAILRKERAVLVQQKEIERLEADLEAKGDSLAQSRDALQATTREQERLSTEQETLQTAVSTLLARLVSLSMLHEDNNTLSADAVIATEVFKSLDAETAKTLESLSRQYRKNLRTLGNLTRETAELRQEISAIEQEKLTLEKAKRKNVASLGELRAKKKRYRKDLRALLTQQSALKKTLDQLNIVKQSSAQKAKEQARKQQNEALLASKPLPKVRSVGSSYHRASTRRYRGAKTIAPLDAYTVTKRYGTFTDPIYHIKIFNESVTLKPKTGNAKVKAVFNGKVILAQETPLLENVVIIEHAQGLHTIYAHLDQIAPTVRKGKRLKKGSVIGRVNDELMFEVTQKNDHIDPLTLFK